MNLGEGGGGVNGNNIEEIQHLTGYISHMCHCSNAVIYIYIYIYMCVCVCV